MTARVRAWSGLLGCLVMLAALTPARDSEQAFAAPVPTGTSSVTPPAASPSAPSATVTPPAPSTTPPVRPTGPASPVAGDERVKFYTVAEAGQSRPESLTDIAGRLLGATGRAQEIYHLNAGRRQADGGVLTDSTQLRAGWTLVLPWDAVGDGVRYGLLPSKPASTSPSRREAASSPFAPVAPVPAPSRRPAAPPTTTAPRRPGAGTPRTSAPTDPAPPTVGPSLPAGGGQAPPPADRQPDRGRKPKPDSCTVSASSRAESRWAYDRMAVDQAWGRTQGEGVLVAVIDSGVDGDAPELSGRVAIGADIPTGSGRGNSDCLGSGTAMAGIVAASPVGSAGEAGRMTGLAPAATILPVRVVNQTPRTTEPGDAATAIEVAASAGARVVALGAYVDLTAPAVRDAVQAALSHDVVVVAPAPTVPVAGDKAAPPSKPEGLLLVGGVGPDGQPAANYRPETVDVLAPGIDVASLGVGATETRANSGSQYAAAFVAGAATLVRSAYPNLSAAQVVHRIKATAERAGQDGPDPVVGWGMINPNAAVSMVLAGETAAAASGGTGSSPLRALTIGLVVVTGLAAVTILARRSSTRAAEAVGAASAARPAPRASGGDAGSAGAETVPPARAVATEPTPGAIGAPAAATGNPVSTGPASAGRGAGSARQPDQAAAEAGREADGPTAPVRR
ncbi:S8 family serine peptidase [Micromonospora sp. NPDC049559]|uniref:S8 family serine peptidase n=1 Tax=Micromonospora sp. NPDC049559 TaxID=3155923 RepID=UPI0034355128